jgi:hypothetical protein
MALAIPARVALLGRIYREIEPNSTWFQVEALRLSVGGISDEKIAYFILLSNECTYSGRFARQFRQRLSNAISNQNVTELQALLMGGASNFVEKDSSGLTRDELTQVNTKLREEHRAVVNMLLQGNSLDSKLFRSAVHNDTVFYRCSDPNDRLCRTVMWVRQGDYLDCFDYLTFIKRLADNPTDPMRNMYIKEIKMLTHSAS